MAKPTPSDAPMRRKLRAVLLNLTRIAIGLALLVLLYYWRIIDLPALRVLLLRPDILALALALSLANIPLEGLRWHVLLRAQGLDLRASRTIAILASSVFFANFLPGAAGGDLIRGLYVYKAARGRRTPALLSILIDRLLGLITFVVIGLFALMSQPAIDGGLFEHLLMIASALFIVLLAVLFCYGDRLAALLNRLTAGHGTRL